MKRKRFVLIAVVSILAVCLIYVDFFRHRASSRSNDMSHQHLLLHAEKWIIVDGDERNSTNLLIIPDVPGWRLVILTKEALSLATKRCKDCVYVSPELATGLPGVGSNNIRLRSYLYAITRGARWIYVTGRTSNLQAQVEGFQFHDTETGLQYDGEEVFDPDAHFGYLANAAYKSSADRKTRTSYKLGEHQTPVIQRKWYPLTSAVSFGSEPCRLPPVMVPASLFPASSLQESLFHEKAFWALGTLLTAKSLNVSFWWRSLLMTHINDAVGLYPPPCKLTKGLSSEDRERHIIENPKVNCDPFNVFVCGLKVLNAIQNEETEEKKMIKLWLDNLKFVNYSSAWFESPSKTSSVPAGSRQVIYEQSSQMSKTSNPFYHTCKEKYPKHGRQVKPIKDILLVVIFNFPTYYDNIRHLNFLYKQYFTNVVYCGRLITNFRQFHDTYSDPVVFLEVNEINTGVFGYMCIAMAMKLGYTVNGYLQASDDVLLNMWNIAKLPRNQFWFQHSIRNGTVTAPRVPNITKAIKASHWWPWNSNQGIDHLRKVFNRLANKNVTQSEFDANRFFTQLAASFGGPQGAFYEASDIFYVPAQFRESFSFLSEMCFKEKLYLEIAIPTMICGLDNISSIVRLSGTYLWYGERTMFWKSYSKGHIFLHPWKLQKLINKSNEKEFFCKTYLADVLQ